MASEHQLPYYVSSIVLGVSRISVLYYDEVVLQSRDVANFLITDRLPWWEDSQSVFSVKVSTDIGLFVSTCSSTANTPLVSCYMLMSKSILGTFTKGLEGTKYFKPSFWPCYRVTLLHTTSNWKDWVWDIKRDIRIMSPRRYWLVRLSTLINYRSTECQMINTSTNWLTTVKVSDWSVIFDVVNVTVKSQN